jgi:hypothetical protein
MLFVGLFLGFMIGALFPFHVDVTAWCGRSCRIARAWFLIHVWERNHVAYFSLMFNVELLDIGAAAKLAANIVGWCQAADSALLQIL